ncbi:hypothetical protein [Niabella beijingensis]|uniref:hypothetical protein n=1 Tax=Niabella beijingensis TaxID=2872700 RepID=UPI001CBC3F06|nr:hypothetical protein [Niabella beijingensis]MBZ4187898.1 hypothetical protein [Niabella beijingensis]
MRFFFVLFILGLLAAGCGTGTTTNRDVKHLSPEAIQKKLLGNWLVFKVGTRNATEEQAALLQDTLSRLKDIFELNTFIVSPGKVVVEDSLGRWQQRTWELLPPDIIGFKEEENVFEIVTLSDSILTLSSRIDYKKAHADIMLACYRIKTEGYGDQGLAATALSRWRTKPAKPETPAAIAGRVVSLLQYDGIYLEALNNSGADYFNTRRFQLPFSYYNGGVMLKPFDSSSRFAGLFFNAGDARTAHGLLKEYFEASPYPEEDNYMLAYSAFMKNLAAAIQKGNP